MKASRFLSRRILSSAPAVLMLALTMIVGVLPALPVDEASAQGTGQYFGTKLLCPPGYDLQNSSPQEAFDNCTLPLEEAPSFTIRSNDSSYQGSTQSGGQFGWTDVPLGFDYFVTESLPQGYLDPWVYCEVSQFAAGGGDVQNYYFQAPGGEMFIAGDINNYELSNCFWFNVQAGGDQQLQPTGTTVTIEKRICLPEYDPATNSLDELDESCDSALGDVRYILNNDTSNEQTTDGNGLVSFSGVPYEALRIHELKDPSYEPRRVFCRVYPATENPGSFEQDDELNLTEQEGAWYVDTHVPEGSVVSCIWFNVIAHEGATVYIEKYLCSSEFDYENADLSQFGDDCDTPHEGVHFEIPINAGGHEGTTDSNGELQLPGVQYGNIELNESEDPGYFPARAYCYSTDVPNGQLADDKEVEIIDDTASSGGYTIQYEIPEGHDLYCYIFNVPYDEDGFGVIDVTKYICHEDYDYSSASLEDLLDNCTQPHEGAGVNLLKPGVGQFGGATNAAGEMEWTDFPSGPLTVLEQTEGYALVRAYCHGVPANQQNSVLSEYTESSIYRNGEFYQADTHLEPGYYLHCYLFNVSADTEYGTVYAHKYNCPPDFDYEGGGRDYLFENCTETPDIHFSLDVESPAFHEEWLVNPEGWSVFDQVPAGPFLLTEEGQDGYQLVAVYCGVTEQNSATLPGTWDDVEYGSGVQYEAVASQYVHCEFYNAPTDYGSVVITKYLCSVIQVGIGDPITYETFAQQCTDRGSAYQFNASSGGTDYPAQSDGNGDASWTELSPGEYVISESLPTGYESYAVYCTTDPTAGTWEEYAAETVTTFNYTVETGVTLYCHWFNWVPDANTHVEVVKYLCPEGYDYAAAPDHATISAACAETIDGVQFSIYNEAGYQSQKTTSSGGYAEWDTVPASLVSIQERPGPGYLPVKVYCSNTPSTDAQQGPFQGYDLDAVDYRIEIGVSEDYVLICHWFNAPAESGQVLVTKYTCDLFFTRGDASYQDYVDNCTTPGEGFHFSLVNSNDDIVDEGTTIANGTVPLISSPPGTHSIVETETEGYITLAVYCTTDLNNPPASQEGNPPRIDTSPDFTVYCFWFNAPYEPSPYDPGDIVIHKYDCPPGYPTEAPGGRSPFEWLFNGCQQPDSGVSFNVEQGGANVGSGSTDSSGTAVISGVAAGATRISELPKEGWGQPIILCASYPATTGRVLVTYDEQTVDNWGHAYDLVQDEVLECFWFNFPPSEGTDGQPIQIIVHKYLCEESSEYSGQSYADISVACAAAEEGVNFDLSGGDGSSSGGPTDLNGYAEYNGVVPGSISITETPREGFRTLAVYCTNYVTTPGDPSHFPSEEGQLLYYVAPGYTFECYWFNAPVNEYGHVIVHKHTCHEDYDHASATREELAENCIEPGGAVMFNLGGPSGYSSDLPTDSGGNAEWADLAPGAYILTETPPEGYYPVRIYCTVYPDGAKNPTDPTYTGTWDDYTASPDNILDIDLTVEAGYWIYCVWYNAPQPEYGFVVIYKYACQDEQPTWATRDEYYANCTTALPDVRFDVAGAGGYEAFGQTDVGGLLSLQDVPAGPVNIWETPPSDYRPWVVYCGFEIPGNLVPTTWEERPLSSDYSISHYVTKDMVLYCEWYNVPYEEDPPQVWIQKYNCPEEADWHWNYHQLLAECHEAGANVEYGIGPDENSLSLSVTDASGRIVLGDLDPGSLSIQETYPSGYSGFVVYCQFATPHDTGSYQKADVYNRTIKLELEDGYVVTCVFFNFLEDHQPPDVSPPSTGHPPLQPSGPSGGGTGGGGTGGGTTGGGTGGGTTGGSGGTIGQPPVDPSTPANLIITKFTCDEAYDVLAENADATLDCTELTNEIAFSLSSIDDPAFTAQNRQTGDDGEGIVEFASLPAGSYLLTESLPEGTIAAFITTCESDRRDFQQQNPFIPFAFAGPDGRIGVTLEPGETLKCDWFDVPEEAPGGEVTVLKFACPGASVIVAQCSPWSEGATISFSPVGDEGGEPVEVTTGPDGSAVAEMEGTFTVQELPDTACLVDSESFDQEGNLVVNVGDQIEVRVYNCGIS